jgi:hypothetical protein
VLVLVAGAVARRPARQVPHDGGCPAGGAADHAGRGGVHAHRARQLAADPGRPGQRRVAQVVRQLPQDRGDIGDANVEPGVAEHQPGELPGRPRQQAGRARAEQAVEHELLREPAKRRGVRRAVLARQLEWPLLTPHPGHPLRLSITVGVAAGAQEGVVLVEVGGDQEPQGGGAAPVVGAGLAAVAVLAAAGAPAAAVGVELVEWLGCPAGGAALARRLAGHAGVGTLVAHLGGVLSGASGSRRR